MSHQTTSELLFETFCTTHQLNWERLAPNQQPGEEKPDYAIRLNDRTIDFEIKEITSREGFDQNGYGSRTVGNHVRAAIESARQQIKTSLQRGNPSILLIYNAIDPMQLFGTDEHDFKTAMYGELTLSFTISENKFSDVFHGRNAKLRSEANQQFSGVGHLMRWPSDKIAVTIYENAYAANRIPFEEMPECFDIRRIEIERF
jgi:hypothetical protein